MSARIYLALLLLVSCVRSQTAITVADTYHAVVTVDDGHPEIAECLHSCGALVGDTFGRCLAACPRAQARQGNCLATDRGPQQVCGEFANYKQVDVSGSCDDLSPQDKARMVSCKETNNSHGNPMGAVLGAFGLLALIAIEAFSHGIKA